MKIWYQSASAYRYEPVWDDYGQTLESQCRRILHPDTGIYVTGIAEMVRDIENWRCFQYFQNVQTLNAMRQAEREGFDAFVVGCTLDVGVAEGRSLVNLPIVGISENAYHLAMTLGRMFAVVTSSSAFCEVYGEQAVRYGVASRMLPGPYIVEASEEEIATSLANPGPLLDHFIAQCERAVRDGASVIVPGPAFLATLAHRAGLTEVMGAPVLDTISAAVKCAEMMASLYKIGVTPSRRIGAYARPDPNHMDTSLARLSKQFRIA